MTVTPEELARLSKIKTWQEVGATYGMTGEAARSRVKRWRDKGGKIVEDLSDLIEELPDTFDVEEALEIADKLQAILNKIDPVITSIELQMPAEPLAIMFTSCSHVGGRYTFHKGLREIFDEVLKTEKLYLGLLGDEIEGFLAGFPDATAVTDQVLPLKVQMKIQSWYLKQWSDAGKCLFGCHSQHGGKWFEQKVGLNPIKGEYIRTKTPFFDGQGLVKLKVGDEQYIIIVGHSFKGSSIYNLNHPQRRVTLFDYPSADVAVMGDKHSYSVQHSADRVNEFYEGLRPSPYVWHVQVGTAKIGPDPYTIRGWQRGWFEWPVLVFYPDKHCIKQAYELGDLEYLLGH